MRKKELVTKRKEVQNVFKRKNIKAARTWRTVYIRMITGWMRKMCRKFQNQCLPWMKQRSSKDRQRLRRENRWLQVMKHWNDIEVSADQDVN